MNDRSNLGANQYANVDPLGLHENSSAECLDRLAKSFEASSRRWELIVYPSLFAFIILASYGFYLIYSLTKDIHFLAESVDRNMGTMSENMREVSSNMQHLSANIEVITVTMAKMSDDMDNLGPMLASMDSMNSAVRDMSYSMSQVRNDMATMNHNIGRPMSFMNTFMPW